MNDDFKKHLLNIKNEKRISIEKAFIHFYTNVRFEEEYEKKITDGPRDGGIDAVVFNYKKIYVIQAEFCNELFYKKRKLSPLSIKKYALFDSLPTLFRNKKVFSDYLKTVEPSIHSIYKKIAKAMQEDSSNVIWEITTLHSRSISGEKRLQNIDSADIRYASDNLRLFELSLEGATPPADPLEINFTEHFIVDDSEKNIKTYVAQASLKDFIDYIDHDPQLRVLARNVRGELMDKNAKAIKKEMIKTYEKNPWEFWYSHNGMTIICDKALIKGKKIYLNGPYIINGSQTVNNLKGLNKRDPRSKILVKVIEISSEDKKTKKFINSIIYRTNQQNRMYSYDLRANDVIQVELAKNFLIHKVFYERRRGDWDLKKRNFNNNGLSRLRSKEIAQILISCDYQSEGVSLAKKA